MRVEVNENSSRHERPVPQVLYEYWVVAIRATTENGLDMSASNVGQAIESWLDVFTLLRDERGIFSKWYDLVRQFAVNGKKAHDARLVAAMERHSVTHLLTFNVGDFRRYPKIKPLDPDSMPGLVL